MFKIMHKDYTKHSLFASGFGSKEAAQKWVDNFKPNMWVDKSLTREDLLILEEGKPLDKILFFRKAYKVDGKIYFPSGFERTSDRFQETSIAPFSQDAIDAAKKREKVRILSNEVLLRLAKLKLDYTHADLSAEQAKVLDVALKEIGY